MSLNGYAIATAGGTNGDYERMITRERIGRKRKQEYLRGCPAQLGSDALETPSWKRRDGRTLVLPYGSEGEGQKAGPTGGPLAGETPSARSCQAGKGAAVGHVGRSQCKFMGTGLDDGFWIKNKRKMG